MEKSMNNKEKIMVGVIVTVLGIVLFSLSYAFVEILMPVDNTNKENFSVTTASGLKLTYIDCASSKTEDCENINKDLGIGESVTKTFQIKNETSEIGKYNLYFKELQNSFKNDELVYKIENMDTGEILVDTTPVPYCKFPTINLPIKENISISKNTVQNYKMTITFLSKDYIQNENADASYSVKISVLKKGNPDFTKAATTDEGVYALEDDYGTSYYYRGAVENNYVKFGKNASGEDMYWRIIRVNGDGSLRIMYDGTQAFANGTDDDSRYAITNQAWNTKSNDAKYVGWMFGGADGEASTSKEEAQKNETDSDIKEKVDEWYVENIQGTGYSKYLTDAVFCNDRSIPGNTGWTNDTALGYGSNITAYGTFGRFIKGNGTSTSWKNSQDNVQPTFKCENKNDAFTLKDNASSEVVRQNNEKTVGNKVLTYPVGLITADEIVSAGSGLGKTNSNYYLYKSSSYYSWSLSPEDFSGGGAIVFRVNTNGQLNHDYVYYTGGAAAPVINLSSATAESLIGNGNMTNPYQLKTE